MDNEKILSAAIKFKLKPDDIGYHIFTGKNHGEIIGLFAHFGIKMVDRHDETSGFLTTKFRFVDRQEALKIAKENNQIVYKHQPIYELMSEDLYLGKEGE